jgi:hypothetical protein
MVKDTMKRKKPSFNEEYHGYRTFSELLEDAAAHGVIDIERHKGSGTYVVTRLGSEPKGPPPAPAARSPRVQRPAADGRSPAPQRRQPERGAAPARKPAAAPVAVPEAVDDMVDLIEDRYAEE